MATNLVSYAMQFLTPDLIARIAAALGLDRNGTQSAVTAAVPALLAAFSGTAATPGGARGLARISHTTKCIERSRIAANVVVLQRLSRRLAGERPDDDRVDLGFVLDLRAPLKERDRRWRHSTTPRSVRDAGGACFWRAADRAMAG